MAIGRRDPKVSRASQLPPVLTVFLTALSMKPTAPPPTNASMPIFDGGVSCLATGSGAGIGSYIGAGGGAGATGGTMTTADGGGASGSGGATGSGGASGSGGGGASAIFLGTSQVLTFTTRASALLIGAVSSPWPTTLIRSDGTPLPTRKSSAAWARRSLSRWFAVAPPVLEVNPSRCTVR